MNDRSADDALKENEKLEEYIGMLQKEPSPEMLSVVLTQVRRRANAGGQMIVPVDTDENGGLKIQVMRLEDGETWLPAYTGFEEQLLGKGQVMSTFLGSIDQLLEMALQEESVSGLLVNPWGKTLRLDKNLIRIIRGES